MHRHSRDSDWITLLLTLHVMLHAYCILSYNAPFHQFTMCQINSKRKKLKQYIWFVVVVKLRNRTVTMMEELLFGEVHSFSFIHGPTILIRYMYYRLVSLSHYHHVTKRKVIIGKWLTRSSKCVWLKRKVIHAFIPRKPKIEDNVTK